MIEEEKIEKAIEEATAAFHKSFIEERDKAFKNGAHHYASKDMPKTIHGFIAEALVANGIRDINKKGLVAVEGEVSIVPENIIADVKAALDGKVEEWKRKASSFDILRSGPGKCYPHDNVMLYKGENVEKIAQERDEYKHNTEVMERALSLRCENCDFIEECNSNSFAHASDSIEFCKNKRLQQAEREIKENKK